MKKYSMDYTPNIGDYIDPDNGNPICSRCLLESGHHDLINGEWVIDLPKYIGDELCWSCQQMIDENLATKEP